MLDFPSPVLLVRRVIIITMSLLPLVRGPLLLSLADRTKSSLSGDPVDEVACVGEFTSRKAIVAVYGLGETAFHVNEKGYVSVSPG